MERGRKRGQQRIRERENEQGRGGKAGWEKEEKEWEEAGSVLVSTDAIKYAEGENR